MNGVLPEDRALVDRYYRAMQAGSAAGDALIGVFAEDATYVEPFAGAPAEHRGRDAIRAYFDASRAYAPPDLSLTLDAAEVRGDTLRTEWTCTSPALPGPQRGVDEWTIRGGTVVRLVTRLLGPSGGEPSSAGSRAVGSSDADAPPAKPRTVDGYVAGLDPERAAVVEALRALVREAAPEAREAFKWAQPVWEAGGPVCYAKAFRGYVNFGFWRGAELAERADPEQVLSGEGGKMRHARLVSAADIRREPLVRLVRAAVDLNRRFGDPTKGAATRAR